MQGTVQRHQRGPAAHLGQGVRALLGQVTSQIGCEGCIGIIPWRTQKMERLGNILKGKNIIHNIPEWESTKSYIWNPEGKMTWGKSRRPYKTCKSSRLHPNDFEQKRDAISFRLLVAHPGEGRELTGGWRVWIQGKQQELFQRRGVIFTDSVAMEIERKQRLRFCVGLGLTVTLVPSQDLCKVSAWETAEHTQKSGDHPVQALTLLLISFVTMGKLFNLLGPEM